MTALLDILSNEFKVMFTAALPVIEVKGAIPVGIALGMGPIHAAFLAYLGSAIPVPAILFTVRPLFNYLKQSKIFKRHINKFIFKSMKKSGNVKKYGYLGLFLFVGIPLPGTGVWTGSIIAALLNLRFKYAFPTILAGNFIASLIILILSFGMVSILGE